MVTPDLIGGAPVVGPKVDVFRPAAVGRLTKYDADKTAVVGDGMRTAAPSHVHFDRAVSKGLAADDRHAAAARVVRLNQAQCVAVAAAHRRGQHPIRRDVRRRQGNARLRSDDGRSEQQESDGNSRPHVMSSQNRKAEPPAMTRPGAPLVRGGNAPNGVGSLSPQR
jgi:hypothetical protein